MPPSSPSGSPPGESATPAESPAGSATSATELRQRLPDLTLRDERRLRRRLERLRKHRDAGKQRSALVALAREVDEAQQRVARRRAWVPTPTYPPELPVTAARDKLLDAVADAQVVVVAGETGSGKTTQLPKICLELGRGIRGRIGHTQPRRLAARTVAARIAEELDVELGAQVGYQVRFSNRASEDTLVKVLTDGVLLTEIQRDPTLRAYDTIILDEAHERSLNIDFLLGYLKQLLPRRPDLKVVITSATIDVERLSHHFAGAPIVEVSGRTYPVAVRYRPLTGGDDGEEADQVEGICAAVEELRREGPGDILVFLPGERDIRDTADALRELPLPDTEILPLNARLSATEQQRVFAPHRRRRIVLATNVAETSLTVPGIRYVVDAGTARVSRYSHRTKVQRLPIEKISRASAEQRKGRCGRVADGICIRLYAEEDFHARPEFTDPEILRTNLASVILQMTAVGLGDVAAFPFVDPPDRRSVRDAEALLAELGAIAPDGAGSDRQLTPVGRTLARLPVDPRLGRMIIEGHRHGCLAEVLIITAALSIQDPRERPGEAQGEADALHSRFADERSDFAAYLHLWEYLAEQQRALSSNTFRRKCKSEYLHHLRVREWWDLHDQLRSVAEDEGMAVQHTPAEAHTVDRALLAGLLSQIGMRPTSGREYQGARGTRFAIWPGSGLAGKPPPWVMAAELVETSRLWARTVAAIDPQWAEQLAGDLVTRAYSEPRWDRRRGAAVADEKITLDGVPLVPARTVPYHRVDPAGARELFIRHALLEQDWDTHHRFLQDNRRLLDEAAELEHRARRRDLVADDDALAEFYRQRLPAAVVSARHFDHWWKDAAGEQPDLLTFPRELLLPGADTPIREGEYPDVWPQGALRLALWYRFEPGAPDDGVTVEVPLAALHQLSPDGFEWLVPGMRDELVTEMIRGLPKQLRRSLGPVPDLLARVLPALTPVRGRLPHVLAEELRRHTGVVVPPDAWPTQELPAHLRMTFRVVDGDRTVAEGEDLPALQRQLAGQARTAVAESAADVEGSGQRSWTFGTLPRTVQASRGGAVARGYPALVDEGDTVGVRLLLSEEQQQAAMWQGTRRLLLLSVPPPSRRCTPTSTMPRSWR